MVHPDECENGYLNEIFSHIDLNGEYNFIVGRSNTPKETLQLKDSILENKRNILILKSDERGITPPYLDDFYCVFRMYNNNNLVDNKKIFPIPCGYCTSNMSVGGTYKSGDIAKKKISERSIDLFYSGQRSPKRSPMINSINQLSKKYNILINETNGFGQGFNLIDYYKYLSDSKIALVPEGAVIPESFRYFESFEKNCIVITTFPRNTHFNNWYYEKSPAIFLNTWDELNESVIDDALDRINFFEKENEKYFNDYISPRAVAEYIKKIIINIDNIN